MDGHKLTFSQAEYDYWLYRKFYGHYSGSTQCSAMFIQSEEQLCRRYLWQ